MTAEPSANCFRAAVLAGNGARTKSLIVEEKHARDDRSIDGLHSVAVPREETRRGNQRGRDRHRLSGEHAIIRHDGREHDIELINLSGGGAMIRAPFELLLWDRVELVLGEGGALECAVRWIKGDRIGLEFAHETQIDCDAETRDALLRNVIRKSFPDVEIGPLDHPDREIADETADDAERAAEPRAERHPLVWNGMVYHDGGADPVRLRNISTSGTLVQCAEPLPEGANVRLEIGAAGSHGATVRWTRGDQSGLEFKAPFDLHCLSKSRPDIAAEEPTAAFGHEAPEAPGWKRASLNDLARNLGG